MSRDEMECFITSDIQCSTHLYKLNLKDINKKIKALFLKKTALFLSLQFSIRLESNVRNIDCEKTQAAKSTRVRLLSGKTHRLFARGPIGAGSGCATAIHVCIGGRSVK